MIQDWNPYDKLKTIEAGVVNFSSGFLSSRPERWFPNLSSHWLLLAANLNLQLKINSVKPLIEEPPLLDNCWSVSCGESSFAVGLTSAAAEYVSNLFLPDARGSVREITLEYLARRFVNSLSHTWSGPAFEQFAFIGKKIESESFPFSGAVQLNVELNERQFDLWILLSVGMVEKLDGLWRRQTKSIASGQLILNECDLEIAGFEVPVTEINQYLTQGNIIRLDQSVIDGAVLCTNSETLADVDLFICDQRYALKIRQSRKAPLRSPSGSVRISAVLANLNFESALAGQLAREGSFLPTATPVGNQVQLKVEGQVVAEAFIKEENSRLVLEII